MERVTGKELIAIERTIRAKVGPPNNNDELILRLIDEIHELWKENKDISTCHESNSKLIKEGEELQKTIDMIRDVLDSRDF